MCITINPLESCIYIPDCMMAEEIRLVMPNDEYIGMLSEPILHSWPSTKAEVQKDPHLYRLFRDEITIIDSIAMKDRRIILHAVLEDKALKQLT